MRSPVLLAGVMMSLLMIPASVARDGLIPVFVLAGQSNAVGYGLHGRKTLRENPLLDGQEVLLWYSQGNPERPEESNRWISLGKTAKGTLPAVGPELAMARSASRWLGGRVGIVKIAYNGTLLAMSPGRDWNTGSGELFEKAVETVEESLRHLPENMAGRLAGIFWVQGESDAKESRLQPMAAASYEENLLALIRGFRNRLSMPKLPFIMAGISVPQRDAEGRVFSHRDVVRKAQQKVAATEKKTALVETNDLSKQADGLHYDMNGQKELGRRLIQAWARLSQ